VLPSPTPDQLPALIVLGTVAVVVLAFHYAASAAAWQRWIGPDLDQGLAVVLQRLSGVVLLGVVPAMVGWLALGLGPAALGLGVPEPGVSAGFVVFIAVLVLPFVRWSARQPESWAAYPEIRAGRWDARLRALNLASWAAYLLAYEFFFRGFVLVPLVAFAGLWPGIAIMTVIYVAVHLTQPAGEAVGTLPMGVIFAGVALGSGAVWACWLGHVLIAVGNDHWVVAANPELERA
jgi:uncharacterized protein